MYVWGLPLQAWSSKHFRQITATVGDFVDMDDEAEDKRQLDRARVLIKTLWAPNIQHTIDVVIDEETFKVHVAEECGGGCCSRYGPNRSVGGSSEEIDSDDTHLDCATPVSARTNNLEVMPYQSEKLPENLLLDDHRTNALPSGHNNYEDPLGNEEDRSIFSALDHQIDGRMLDIPKKAPTVTDNCHGAADNRRQQGIGSPNNGTEPQTFHENGNGDRGGGQRGK